MSKGSIKKPSKPIALEQLYGLRQQDAIYEVVQTCEVEVDNEEWQNADKQLQENLTGLENRVAEIDKRLGDNQGNLSDEIKAIKEEIRNLKVRRPLDLIVKVGDAEKKDLGKQHYQLPTLISILETKLNAYIVGPAGAGKTHAAQQAAKALGVPFYFTGAIASEFKLTGFIDAQGKPVFTEFRKAYEHGGLFLFDEIDGSYPQAVLAFNAALSNNFMDFPDKRVERHKDFYCIAAANTWGQGADRQYVGRNQLDAASLDRFVFLPWNYDENLERDLAGNDDWTDYIHKVRGYVEKQKMRYVVSPRASIFGAQLLANGIERNEVENLVVWKGMTQAEKEKVLDGIKPRIEVIAHRTGTFYPRVKIENKVEQGEVVGEIRYRPETYSYREQSEDVKASHKGIIDSIIGEKSVLENTVVAVIKY
jgi:hypothetical protein